MAGNFGVSLNHIMPRATSSGVVGPPKLKMPQVGGDSMPRMSGMMPKASLGQDLKPLPTHPFQATNGTPSLLQTKSPVHSSMRPLGRKRGGHKQAAAPSGGLDNVGQQ